MTDGKKYLESDLEIASKPQTNKGFTKRLHLRVGRITSVFPNENTVNIQWLFPNRGGMDKLELTRPYVGYRSGINFVPEVNSIVTVGFAEDLPILLTYSTPASFTSMISGFKNTSGESARMRKLNSGEIDIYSNNQAELYLSDKVLLQDGTSDRIIIDPADGSINLDSLNLFIQNDAGKITMGIIKRNNEFITNDGQPVTTLNGGFGLTELRFEINKYSENSINDSTANTKIADITIGTKVDDSGNIVLDQVGKEIVCQISLSSGAVINVNEDGKININQGNMIKPTDTTTRTKAESLGVQDTFTSSDTQQRAAREGDRIIIPLTTGQTDLDHPQLNTKATSNITELSQLAGTFLVMGIPATFIPSIPNLKLFGEITQGSDSVFIGSLDKTAEKQEISNNS